MRHHRNLTFVCYQLTYGKIVYKFPLKSENLSMTVKWGLTVLENRYSIARPNGKKKSWPLEKISLCKNLCNSTNYLLEHGIHFVFPEVVMGLIVILPSCLSYSNLMRSRHFIIRLCRVKGSLRPQIRMSVTSLWGGWLLTLTSLASEANQQGFAHLEYNKPEGH